MNIDDNFFTETFNKQELLNILNEKINEINNKLNIIDDKLNNLQTKQKQLEIKYNNLEITIANLNKNNFIESYKNLRKGLVFPHSTILSRDISDITHQNIHTNENNMY
jgi:DNA repair exonuclease SbcCD ATPase subunit